MKKNIKGYLIAATGSGSGKTTISLGIMAWLIKNGYNVAPFKVGPDFIDPGHHMRITGKNSRNLDGWMLSKDDNLKIYQDSARDADISIVEGVMGLFDGYDGKSEAGSTAQMAKWLDLPVILVVNAKSMARSVAALIKGFVEFDPEVNFAGVIFNNLGSKNHYSYLTEAVSEYLSIPVLGGILRDERISMPERHLGLVTDNENMLKQEDIDCLTDIIEGGIDTVSLVGDIDPSDSFDDAEHHKKNGDAAIRIAVARDDAFCFYYQDNLDLLEQNGAELVFFSPISDQNLPDHISGIYLGGGYPEMFAEKLSLNRSMCKAVEQASLRRMPIYGECGGLMYLSHSFLNKSGAEYKMAGCFPFVTRLRDRFKALGYREICLTEDTILGSKGMTARGHEFHYSEIINTDQDVHTDYSISGRNGKFQHEEGYRINRTLGSYVHLHFRSNPLFAKNFVEECIHYKRKQDLK